MINVWHSTGLKYFLIKQIAWSADLDFLMVFATWGDHCNWLSKIMPRIFMDFLDFTNASPTLIWMSGQSCLWNKQISVLALFSDFEKKSMLDQFLKLLSCKYNQHFLNQLYLCSSKKYKIKMKHVNCGEIQVLRAEKLSKLDITKTKFLTNLSWIFYSETPLFFFFFFFFFIFFMFVSFNSQFLNWIS